MTKNLTIRVLSAPDEPRSVRPAVSRCRGVHLAECFTVDNRDRASKGSEPRGICGGETGQDMSTRHNACVVVAILLCISTTQAATIFVDDDNCPGPGNGSERRP